MACVSYIKGTGALCVLYLNKITWRNASKSQIIRLKLSNSNILQCILLSPSSPWRTGFLSEQKKLEITWFYFF